MTGQGLSRRTLLQAAGGGLAVGCLLGRASSGRARQTAGPVPLNAWVLVRPDDTVILRVASAEMGQGIHGLLAMLVAEELEVDPRAIVLEAAPLSPEYDNPLFGMQITGNSSSAANAFVPLRRAGAQARMLLLAAAAAHWHCRPDDCVAADGIIRRRDGGAALGYGALAAEAALLRPPADVKLKPRADWRRLGRPAPRLGAAGRLDGTVRFGIDIRLPDMAYAAVRNCPVPGGRLVRVEDGPALAVAGVTLVLPLADAVLVIATSTWAAFQGVDALRPVWDDGAHAGFDSAAMAARLDQALATPGLVAADHGTVAAGTIKTTVSLRFDVPPLAHAALEPPCATVAIGPDGADVWVPTQAQTLARDTVATVLGLAPDRVRIHTLPAGGSFGRKLYADFVAQAALAARAAGRPVKLTWSRAEDLAHDFYRPPAATVIDIGLDQAGLPVSWTQRLAVPDLRGRLERGGHSAQADTIDPYAVEGADSLPYDLARHRLTWHDAPLPIRLGWWRSVGHSFNGWFVEHALDIAVRRAGGDPLAVRLALLAHRPRHLAMLRALGPLWRSDPAPGRFRGTALHESYGSVVALAVEIAVTSAGVRVHRAVCAADCGVVLDPDGVRAQIEGGIIFGLTAALHGEITWQGGRVQQRSFDAYRLLTLTDAPEVDVILIDSDADPAGVGEIAVPPAAPALCNALLAATGQAVTRLPVNRRH